MANPIEQDHRGIKQRSSDASIADHNSTDFGPNDDFTVAVRIKANATQAHTVNPDNDVVEKWSESRGYPYVIRYVNQTGANSG